MKPPEREYILYLVDSLEKFMSTCIQMLCFVL